MLDDEVYDQDYEDDDEVDPEIAGEEILEIAGEEIPEVEVEPEPEQRGPANLPQPRRHERRASNQFRQLARDALRRLGKRGRR